MSLDKRRDLIISTKIKVKLQTKTNTTCTFWNVTSIILKKGNFSPFCFCFCFCFSSSLYHCSFKSYKTSDQRLTKLLYYLWAWRHNHKYMYGDTCFDSAKSNFWRRHKTFLRTRGLIIWSVFHHQVSSTIWIWSQARKQDQQENYLQLITSYVHFRTSNLKFTKFTNTANGKNKTSK